MAAASSICHSNYQEVLPAWWWLLGGVGGQVPPQPAPLQPPCLQGMSTAITSSLWVWVNPVSPHSLDGPSEEKRNIHHFQSCWVKLA